MGTIKCTHCGNYTPDTIGACQRCGKPWDKSWDEVIKDDEEQEEAERVKKQRQRDELMEKWRKQLFWVGLFGVIAYGLYVINTSCWLACALNLYSFDDFEYWRVRSWPIIVWVARFCNLGCFVALWGIDAKRHRAIIGLVGTGLLFILGFMGKGEGTILTLLWGVAGILLTIPIFMMGNLVPTWARIVGMTGAAMDLFWRFYILVPLGFPKYSYFFRFRGDMFWILVMVAIIASCVFFFAILRYRGAPIERGASIEVNDSNCKWCDGRARRSEYWTTVAIFSLGGAVGGALLFLNIVYNGGSNVVRNIMLGFVLALLWALPFYIATIPVTVRRLHDRGMSGWWVLWFALLSGIPFVGWIVPWVQFVIVGCLDGTPGPNMYGPDPKGRTSLPAPGSISRQTISAVMPEERLRKLKALKDEGLISESEYEEKRAKLLATI